MNEAVKVKLKLQWRPKEHGDAKNMECLLRKAMDSKWSHPRRKVMWVANSKALGVGLPKPIGTHITPHASEFTVMALLVFSVALI
jgi:hypothetical protein